MRECDSIKSIRIVLLNFIIQQNIPARAISADNFSCCLFVT